MAPSRERKTEPWHVDRPDYPPELREHAVRMVAEVRPEYLLGLAGYLR